MAKHTPTPWTLTANGGVIMGDNDEKVVADCEVDSWPERARRDAELIVQAVNAHDELVSLLDEAGSALRSADFPSCVELGEKIAEALARLAVTEGE